MPEIVDDQLIEASIVHEDGSSSGIVVRHLVYEDGSVKFYGHSRPIDLNDGDHLEISATLDLPEGVADKVIAFMERVGSTTNVEPFDRFEVADVRLVPVEELVLVEEEPTEEEGSWKKKLNDGWKRLSRLWEQP